MKYIKKGLKYFLWLFLIVFIGINLAIVFTGRFYIYKGVYITYMQGHIRPYIFDEDHYINRPILKGESEPWYDHPKLGKVDLSQEEKKYLESLNTASFLVTWGDTVIYENYWGEHSQDRLSNSFSMAKTIVSLLIGAAIEDGFIKSIDEPVANYLEEFKKDGKEKISIRHILTMSSGLSWSENYTNPFCDVAELYYDTDAKDLTLNRRTVEEEPGIIFDYKSGDTQTLMYIIKEATGKNVANYASEKIWSKIGAESDASWSLVDDVNSEEKSFCCIYATTRDFARLGKLMNQNGNWNGEQLIDEDYVKETKSIAPLTKRNGKPNNLYGFQYWIFTSLPYEVTYYRGMSGQYIISIPEHDLVIVRTGNGVLDNWVNTKDKKDDAMEGHRLEIPDYIKMGMALKHQLE